MHQVRLGDVHEGLVEGAGVALGAGGSGDGEVDGLPVVGVQSAHQGRQKKCQLEEHQRATHFRGRRRGDALFRHLVSYSMLGNWIGARPVEYRVQVDYEDEGLGHRLTRKPFGNYCFGC